MFLDARSLPADTEIDCDLCIMGAGAAGITIARELSSTSLKICILESGDFEFDSDTQDLYKGETVGNRYFDLDTNRMRYLGGATNHWGGNCTPLDPIDFEVRPWVEYSGWPFDRAHLDPYYRRAQIYCQLGPYRYEPEFWADLTRFPILPLRPERMITWTAQHSPPTRFGEVYRDDLAKARNITVYLNANVLNIQAAATGERVSSVRAGVLHGDRFTVTARYFVIAMGGIENARMMLHSDDVHARGLGNENDLVGRFFMDHPVIEGAAFYPTRPLDLRLYTPTRMASADGYDVQGFLKLSDAVIRSEQINNVRLPLVRRSHYYLSEGIMSYHQVRRALEQGVPLPNFWRHAGNMIGDLDMVVEAIARNTFNTTLFESARDDQAFIIDTSTEQTPNPESRITLTEKRDALGLRRVRLNWQIHQSDRDGVWRAYRILAAELGRLGIGRVHLRFEYDDTKRMYDDLISGGIHHMGTTRAHQNPKLGVVDANCKAHSLANLYVAGSSIFPTGGHVPPTLTIVALANRLADHLKKVTAAKG